MAKKLSLDFSKRTPTWAAQLRRDFTDRQNAEARVDAAIGEIVGQEGVAITEEQRNKAVEDYLRSGEFDLQAQPTEEVFPQQKEAPVLPAKTAPVKKPTVELPDAIVKTYGLIEDTYKNIPVLGDIRSSLLAGASDIITDAQFQEIDVQKMKEAGVAPPSLSERALGPVAKFTPLSPIADVVGEVTAPVREAIAGTDAYKTIFGNLSEYVEDTRKEVAKNNRQAIEDNFVLGSLRQAATDVAGSPQSLASLPGGAFAAIPGAISYADAYRQAREAGVSVPEAQKYAAEQAGIEAGISAIPAGKVGKTLLKPFAKTPVGKGLAEVIESRTGRIGRAALGESAEEVVQTGAADAVNRLNAVFAGDDVTREFARGQISKNLPADLARSGLAGLVGGTAFSAPSAQVEYAADQGRQHAETTDYALRRSRDVLAPTREEIEATQEQELRGRIADESLFKEEAFEAREAEEAAAAKQKADEEEAAFRTIEQRRTEEKLSQLGTVTPAPEVTPEQVVQEREAASKKAEAEKLAAAKEEQERQERVELGGLTEDIRKQREAAKKAEEKAAKDKTRKEKVAETKRRSSLAREIALERPELSPDELAPILRERLAQPVAEAPTTPKAAPPKTTAEAAVAAQQALPEPKAPAAAPSAREKEVGDIASQLGLSMQESVDSTPAPDGTKQKFDRPAFEKKVGDTIRNLVGKNTQKAVDVQNLVRQGKAVFVPNAESVGREPGKAAAEFVPEENRFYIYTDKVDANDTTGTIMKALHEATHGGQFNDRDGRPSVLRQLLGDKGVSSAAGKIRVAAKGGNVLAKEAVRKAQADTDTRGGDAAFEDLEVVGYLTSEVAGARSGTLGSLRGVAADIRAAARSFLRDKLKVDLDVDFNDLAAATQKVGGELVKTEVKQQPRKAGRGTPALAIIAGPSSTGFAKAKEEGITYKGFVDQKERYEIADINAEINEDSYEKLDAGKTIKLPDILQHDELAKAYPQIKNMDVVVDENISGDAAYYHGIGPNGTIKLHPLTLAQAQLSFEKGKQGEKGDKFYEEFRNTTLHETQHGIQAIEGFVPGSSSKYLIPAQVTNRRDEAIAAYHNFVKKFELGAAINSMTPEDRAKWDKDLDTLDIVSRDAKALHFLQDGYGPKSRSAEVRREQQRYDSLLENKQHTADKYREADAKAYRDYLKDYGEAEARNTEYRSRIALEQLRRLPPEQTLGWDELSRKHGIKPEELLDTQKTMAARGAIPSKATEESAAPASLAMAEEAVPAPAARRYAPAWFTGLFRSDIGLGRDINEIVEYARSSPAGARLQAEAHLERYGKALNQLAKERGVTPQVMAKEIEDKLDAIDKKSDSYEQNRENFIQVASQYGEAGKNLIALRDMIDDLSLSILRQRAAEGTPLSEKEKATYKTLLSNLGRYAHRTYASNSGKIGDSYAKDVWKSWQKANKGKKLSEGDKANAAKVSRAISYLVDNELNIPEDEELSNISADKARALYSTWIGPRNVDAIPVEQVKEELAAVRDDVNGDKKRLTNQAEATARELLGLTDTTGPLVKYYRGAKQDTGILQERENIPKELRDLLGEIVDPAAKLMITVGKQAEFVARNKMMLELRKHIGLDLQPPDAAGTDAARGMTQLEGEQYGPLEGYYVSPNMRAFIGDTMQQLATFEQAVAMANHKPQELPKRVLSALFDKWASIASISKAASVIGNPVRFIYNYIGSYRQLVSNGNINPKYWVEGHKAMNDVLANALNPSIVTERLKDANTYGVTDSAFIGEIKSEEYRKIANVIKQMSGKNPSAAMAFMKKAKVGYKELYAMMDVWSKLANFYHQVDVLTAFHKANGDKMTEEQIKREAADKVNRTNITYKRAAPLIKGMERGGVTQFGTYFSEVFRSEIGNALEGVAEYRQALNAKTPEARNIILFQSAKRISGQTASWALAAYATRALAQMTFGDDEEKEEKLRALLPEYLRNQDFVVVGKDKDGKGVLFNISQLDPIGPATDIMRSMLNGEASPEQLKKSIIDLYIAPRVGSQLITAFGTTLSEDVRPSKRPTITQEVAPGVYSDLLNVSPLEERQTKAWLNVVETFAPGWVKAARSDNAHPEGATDALTYMGATLYKLEPQKQAKYAAMDYSGALKNSRKNVAEYFTNHPTYSKEQLIAFLLDEREGEREAYDKARKVYEGMVASGMPARKAAAVFKAERLNEATIKAIRRGDFNSQVVSKDSVTQFMKQEIANAKTLEEKRSIKKKWNEAWKILKAADKDIDEGEQ